MDGSTDLARVTCRLYRHYKSDARTSPLFAVVLRAQDSVIPETTPASTSLQSSSVVDLAEDVIEYEIVTYYNKKLPVDKSYPLAKGAVQKGAGNWGRTNITLLNPLTC